MCELLITGIFLCSSFTKKTRIQAKSQAVIKADKKLTIKKMLFCTVCIGKYKAVCFFLLVILLCAVLLKHPISIFLYERKQRKERFECGVMIMSTTTTKNDADTLCVISCWYFTFHYHCFFFSQPHFCCIYSPIISLLLLNSPWCQRQHCQQFIVTSVYNAFLHLA